MDRQSSNELTDNVETSYNDSEELIRSSYSSTNLIHDNLGSSTRVIRGLIHD